MKIKFSHNTVFWLLNGRDKENGGWIPSITEFDKCVIYINDVALYQKCPFAAEWMYKVEKRFEELKSYIEGELNKLININRDIAMFIDDNERIYKEYDCSLFSKLGSSVLNILARYEMILDELYRGKCAGICSHKKSKVVCNRIARLYRKLLNTPFVYQDRGITGIEYMGTMEWEASVEDLGRTPGMKKYNPGYFAVEGKKDRKLIANNV